MVNKSNMEKLLININGDTSTQSISVLDHGFLYGFGLFETMRAYDGYVYGLEHHLKRLTAGAASLGWDIPWTQEELTREIEKLVMHDACPNLYIRLTISRGAGSASPDPMTCLNPNYIIFARPYRALPEETYQRGWRLSQATIRRNSSSPLSRIKSLNYLDNILAKQEAKRHHADEGLLLNEAGYVAEGSMSNIFLVQDGVLVTPCIETGILNGITRQTILDIARSHNIPCKEKYVTLTDLAMAEELFCTSSLLEVMPVTSWNEKPVGTGRAGEVTQKFRQWYRAYIEAAKRTKNQ
jgi:branched-chain amino acid aminotransferase